MRDQMVFDASPTSEIGIRYPLQRAKHINRIEWRIFGALTDLCACFDAFPEYTIFELSEGCSTKLTLAPG